MKILLLNGRVYCSIFLFLKRHRGSLRSLVMKALCFWWEISRFESWVRMLYAGGGVECHTHTKEEIYWIYLQWYGLVLSERKASQAASQAIQARPANFKLRLAGQARLASPSAKSGFQTVFWQEK
jgi:hypothetical protein